MSVADLVISLPPVKPDTMEKRLLEETKQLELDLNDERLRYQNLLNEFSRLEERYDDLKDEMKLMVVSGFPALGKDWCREIQGLDGRLSSAAKKMVQSRGAEKWDGGRGSCHLFLLYAHSLSDCSLRLKFYRICDFSVQLH